MIVFFTMLFAVSEAANRLGFEQVSGLISMFIQFGANILLGAVILMIGFWLANLVAKVIGRGEYNSSRWLANLVRILIIGLVIAMGLRAMGIADSIVNLAFGLTLGSVAVAFALAFGLGGRQPAEQVLTDLIDKCKKDAKEPNPLHEDGSDLMTKMQGADSISAHAAQAFTEHATPTANPSDNSSTDFQMNSGAPSIQTELSDPTLAGLTTAPQNEKTLPDSVQVDPQQSASSNPFGSTGESEPNVDLDSEHSNHPLIPKDHDQ